MIILLSQNTHRRAHLAKQAAVTLEDMRMETKPNKAFVSIRQGLNEALEFSKGNASNSVIHEFTAIDVKDLRVKIGMSQNEFASAFGISVATLRHWERGDRTPQGPALVLLNVVAKEPQAVLRALRA